MHSSYGSLCQVPFTPWKRAAGAFGRDAEGLPVPLQASTTQKLAWALITALPPLIGVAPSLMTMPLFVLEHLSTAGAGKPPLGDLTADVVMGVLFGLVAALVMGHLAAWLAHIVRPFIWVRCPWCHFNRCTSHHEKHSLRYNLICQVIGLCRLQGYCDFTF